MSRFRSDSGRPAAIVVLGRDSCAWRPPGASSEHPPEVAPVGANLSSLSPIIDALSNERIHWVLGIDHLSHWLQAAPIGTRDLRELRAAASAQARLRLGEPADGGFWEVSGQWHATKPFLCSAIPSKLLALLGHRPLISSVLGAGLSAVDSHQRDGWYAFSSVSDVYLVYRHQGHCLHLRGFRTDPSQDAEHLCQRIHQEWRKEMLRAGQPGEALTWVHLAPTPGIALPTDIRWASQPLQSHLSMPMPDGQKPPGDAASTLLAFERLAAWEGAA